MTDDDAIAIVQARSGTMYDPTRRRRVHALLPQLRTADLRADGADALDETVRRCD